MSKKEILGAGALVGLAAYSEEVMNIVGQTAGFINETLNSASSLPVVGKFIGAAAPFAVPVAGAVTGAVLTQKALDRLGIENQIFRILATSAGIVGGGASVATPFLATGGTVYALGKYGKKFLNPFKRIGGTTSS